MAHARNEAIRAIAFSNKKIDLHEGRLLKMDDSLARQIRSSEKLMQVL